MKIKIVPPFTFADFLEIAQERGELVSQDHELKISAYDFGDGRIVVFHHRRESIFVEEKA